NILEMEIKYDGYIEREKEKIEKRNLLLKNTIPNDINYNIIAGLKNEAREKLNRIRPQNLESASRISGVDPPDIDLILMHIRKS
ncbi:MAG: tRNA uridine-5-carboxymethylaminomethyl(34) synthesis enzyme MnmG, partial [Spirochaetia bacterium]|nr:tRNA uridine-5-carboxymethylaminomethyl(34) synthesis enzyme MnmG [Spirochaetia bacterium]